MEVKPPTTLHTEIKSIRKSSQLPHQIVSILKRRTCDAKELMTHDMSSTRTRRRGNTQLSTLVLLGDAEFDLRVSTPRVVFPHWSRNGAEVRASDYHCSHPKTLTSPHLLALVSICLAHVETDDLDLARASRSCCA